MGGDARESICRVYKIVEESMNLHVLQWATPQGKLLQDKVCLAGPALTADDANEPVARHLLTVVVMTLSL